MNAQPLSTQAANALMRSRGGGVWTGLVRGTGVAGLAGLVVIAAWPTATPFVGFTLFTIWVNSPVGMVLPAMYEPVLIMFGSVYPPVAVAALGVIGTLYVEYLNYRVHDKVLSHEKLTGFREKAVVIAVRRLFTSAPFLAVWLCSVSPLPYWPVRILSPLAGYPVRRHLTATALGKIPRLWFFAAIGASWQISGDILLAVWIIGLVVGLGLVLRGRMSAIAATRVQSLTNAG